MSDFNYQPSYNASLARKPRIKAASFGDGYQQRIADGINNTPQQWSLNFQASRADIDAIDAFLTARGGLLAFTWTPSGFAEVKVICSEWARSILTPNTGTISAKFEQVFE